MSKLPTVIGRYQVRSRLGQGGMGYLFLAWDPLLERQIAIKRLRDDNDELRERFAREARSVARLRHPNIVTIYDVGEQDGEPFIAMEYIVGQTMAEIIRTREPLPITRKLEIIGELCDGLGFAHKAGIVHRDIKPANVIVEPEGSVKILDFGIARIAESGMTQAGMLIGTLNYMSPEQVAGQVVDSRSDIFAVGAVFYELLTYRQAFPGGLHNGILNKILNEPPPSLEAACPGIDPEIVVAVERALHKEPGNRYQDLASMRKDLERICQRLESLPKEEVEAPSAQSPQPSADATTGTPGPPHAPRTTEREANARQQQVLEHLDNAYAALAAGDFDAASAAAREALALEPGQAEAAGIQERIRVERENLQVQQWLTRAQELLDAGSLTEAHDFAEQAEIAAPGLPAATKLREAIDAARQAREEDRQRAEALEAVLLQAQSLLDAGSLAAAEKVAAEAMSLSPDDDAARDMLQRIRQAVDERDALERRVEQALHEAESAVEDGRYHDAHAVLRAFQPEHSRIAAALTRVVEAERAHREREEARLREENSARALATAGALSSHEEAISALRAALALDPTHAGLQKALSVREEAAGREREERRLAEERHRQIAALMARAQRTRAHEPALEILKEAQRLEPGREDVGAAIAERQQALAHERELERQARERRERIAAALAKARQTESHEAALGLLSEALRLEPEHAELRQAFDERQVALARDREARLLREREERIAQAIANARDLPSHEAAIALLRDAQRLDPRHDELRRVTEQRQAALVREQEEERRRREREKKIAAMMAKAQRTVSHDAAIAILQDALALDPGHEHARKMLEARRAALADEQRRARELQARISDAIARASGIASHESAIATLEEAAQLDAGNGELRKALEQRRAALDLERAEKRRLEERRQKIADGLAEARKARSHQAAVHILEQLSALDPHHGEVRGLLQERRSALEREQEAARQARIRQSQVAALIAEARSTKSHQDAIAVLTRALAVEPADTDVKALLEARRGALERERQQDARRRAIADARTTISQLIERHDFDAAQAALDETQRSLDAKPELKDLRRALARTRTAVSDPHGAARQRRALQLGIAALLVLATGVGYWLLRPPDPSPAQDAARQASNETQVAPAPAPVPQAPAPAQEPSVPTPEPSTPAPAGDDAVAQPPAPSESIVARTIQRARQQMAQGNLPQATAIVMEGLQADSSSRELRALAADIVGRARTQAVRARGTADRRGEVATSTAAYRDAAGRIADAGRHERAGRYDQAARSLLDAEGLFARAAQTPAPPPPQVAETPKPTSQPEDVQARSTPPGRATPPVTEPPAPSPVTPPAAATNPPAAAPPAASSSKPAATTPPASNTPPAVSDEEGVRAALRAYEQAYSSLKVEAVTRVFPSINASQLKRRFDDLREQQVTLACDRIDFSGTTATATCKEQISFRPRAGSGRTDTFDSVFRLQKAGAGWIIVERR